MKRQHQLVILVTLLAVTSVSCRSATRAEVDDSDGPTLKKSPRVFVNTSIPFSVAPQPVRDTQEVAHAKQTFMKTFQRIHDAVVAADSEHLNFTVLDDELTNNLDDTTSGTTASPQGRSRSFAARGPAPIIDGPAPRGEEEEEEERMNLFPDPVSEPQYFLPSVHVDPFLMKQFNPSLPPNPFIQQIRPITDPGRVGTCYEIVLLEPEGAIWQAPRASQVIPVGTPALPSIGSRKPVAHFKAPQLSFPSGR